MLLLLPVVVLLPFAFIFIHVRQYAHLIDGDGCRFVRIVTAYLALVAPVLRLLLEKSFAALGIIIVELLLLLLLLH